MVTTAMAQETIITSAELNAMTTSKKIAVRNLSGTNNYWLALTSNVQNLSSDAVLVWEPVTEGTAGTYYLKKAYADNSYVQAAASGAITLGAKETAQVFYTTLCSTSGSGETQFGGEALAVGSDLNNLVRFVQNGATTWLNCQNSASNPILGNSGKGGWTVHNVYDMSDYYVLTISITKDDETTTTTSLVKAGATITVPEYTGYTSDYTANETMPSSDKTITVTYTKESSVETGISATKSYFVATASRGGWAINDEGTAFVGYNDVAVAVSTNEQKQFAFVTYEGNTYLYSVWAKKFVTKSAGVTEGPDYDALTYELQADGTYFFKFDDSHIINLGGSNQMTVDDWNKKDGGNLYYLTEAGDFDASEALAYFAKESFVVTYSYVYEGTIIATEEHTVVEGSEYPTPGIPSGYTQKTATPEGTVTETTTVTIEIERETIAINSSNTELKQTWTNAPTPWTGGDLDASEYPAELTVGSGSVRKAETFINAEAGVLSILFKYSSGAHRLNMLGVDIVDGDGNVVASDYHVGFTGGAASNNTYSFTIPTSGKYTLRYFVNHISGGGELGQTNGNITVTWTSLAGTLNALITEATSLYETASAGVGTAVGTYTEASVAALQSAIDAAEALTEVELSDIEALENAMNALAVNMPEKGKTYQIVSAYPNGNFAGKAMAAYSTGSGLSWKANNTNDKTFYWYIEPIDGGYSVKNVGTEKYLSTVAWNSRATEGDTPATVTLTALGETQFNIISTNRLHCQNHGNGSGTSGNIIGYDGYLNSVSAWYIIETELPDNFVSITYNFTYGGETKYTQTIDVVEGLAYPDYTITLPYGVTAGAKPEGTVTGATTHDIALTIDLPFEYAASYDEIESGEKWYYMTLHATALNYLYYDGSLDYLDASKTAVDSSDKDAYTWGFVGSPFDGFQIVNRKAGSTMVLTSTEPESDQTYPVMATGTQVWDLSASTYGTNGFFIAYDGTTKRLNKQNSKVCYWLDGADAGSTFMLEARPMGPVAELEILIAEAEALLASSSIGTEVGCYSQETADALSAAIATAEEKVNNATATADDITALETAMNGLTIVMPDANKIYMIQSGLGAFYSEQGINKAIYNNGTLLRLSWGDADDTDLTQMWKFAATEGGYTIQNCSDNLYANGLSMSEEAATTTLNFIGVKQFNIVSDGATLYASNHGNGTGEGGIIISYEAGVNSASSWLLIDVTDKYDAAVEKAAIEAARAELRAAIEDARSQITYDETTVALSTEEGNGYITCPQEHGTINPTETSDNAGVIAMIDGNKSTYMHTAWKNTPEAPHYIQIDLGADATIEQFKFNTTNRSGCLNDFPKTYEIEGSNDGENFTAITTVTSTASSAGGSFESENIGKRGVAYRYLRFKVTDCYPSYRTYFHLAEFTLTKVELRATEGNTGWFALIQEGMAADNEDATVESLTAATTKLVTAIEKGKAMTALKNAYDEFKAIKIGNELGQYNGNEETINSTIANVEDILSRRDEALAATENSTIEEATEAIATLKTTLVYNMPITNGYYRFESCTYSGDYMLSDVYEGDNTRLAMGAGDDASSIFYLGTDNTLSSYEIGRYLPKAVAGGDWTCTAIGTEGATVTFGKGTAEGTYGFYIGDDASRAYHSGTKSWVNAGGAMTAGDGYAWVIEKVTSLPVTVTSAGYATFYAPVAVTIPAGVKVYYIKETSNNFAILAEVTEAIPANTGVILVAEAGTYDFEITEDEVAALEGNKLQGTAVSTIITKETGAYYVLGVIDDEIGMYNPKNGEDNTTFINAGHKAYLYLEGASQSTGYRFGFEGTTGIIELNGESGDDIIYDLTGRRVEKAVKGIYIINGKKTLVK